MIAAELSPTSRLLILAPHPDDEALGCGGLIQHALHAGAAVRVVFVTNGDNNPWPQRVLERRLRITADRRTAWGQRRTAEAMASAKTLGLGDSDVVFASLPDQGLTDDLLAGHGRFAAVLRHEIAAFGPTVIVGPSLADTHADHSAIAVTTRLLAGETTLLEYSIHGQDGPGETIALTPAQQRVKRDAIACHRTQMALSARRFLSYATPTERFIRVGHGEGGRHPVQSFARDGNGWAIRLRPHRRYRHWAGRHVDLLGVSEGRITVRRRVKLARHAHVIDLTSGEVIASGCHHAGRLHLPVHAMPAGIDTVLAKRKLRFGFFDEAGWCLLPLPGGARAGVRGETSHAELVTNSV